jgi:hypothetical protein
MRGVMAILGKISLKGISLTLAENKSRTGLTANRKG